MRPILSLITAIISAALFCGCDSLDDDRIPPAAVNISFPTVAEWNIYGVASALDHRSFIPEKHLPKGFYYTASTYCGFGGVLLVGDVMGNPMAYDLACPVECRSGVRVAINGETNLAECPQCHSTYDVFSLMGHPTSGEAAEKGYGLRRYRVSPGRGTVYMQVNN